MNKNYYFSLKLILTVQEEYSQVLSQCVLNQENEEIQDFQGFI